MASHVSSATGRQIERIVQIYNADHYEDQFFQMVFRRYRRSKAGHTDAGPIGEPV